MASKKKIIKKIKKELKNDKLLLLETVISCFILLFVVGLALYSFLIPRHTVLFNSNGGTTITSKRVKHNKTISEPEIPIRDGYEFVGWYYNDEEYLFDNKVTENIELIAKWEEISVEQVQKITLNVSEFSLKPNESLQLPYSVYPAVETKLYWESSDSSVVSVDSTGYITAKNEGSATIKVSSSNGIEDSILIYVSTKAIAIQSLAFQDTEITIDKGSVKQLKLIINPNDATNLNVIWTSDDTSVVSVDSVGVISAKKIGQAVIVVTSLDGSKIAKCKVNVVEA